KSHRSEWRAARKLTITRIAANRSTINRLWTPRRVERLAEKALRLSTCATKNATKQMSAIPSQRVTSQSWPGATLYAMRPATPNAPPNTPRRLVNRFILASHQTCRSFLRASSSERVHYPILTILTEGDCTGLDCARHRAHPRFFII